MIVTGLALLLMLGSVVFVAREFRGVAADTATTLCKSARRAKRGGRIASSVAFVCLWLTIFLLGYG